MKRLFFVYLLLSVVTTTFFAQEAKPGAYPFWSKGKPEAPITIEVFNDYACPGCVASNTELNAIFDKYPSQVQVIYRYYPLKAQGHENARAAAQALEAAGLQGKFFEMKEVLLEKQDAWRAKTPVLNEFLIYAKTLNLDLDEFKLDFESVITRQKINEDIERGLSFKIAGTPSIFFNGVLISNAEVASRETLEEKIKEFLQIK